MQQSCGVTDSTAVRLRLFATLTLSLSQQHHLPPPSNPLHSLPLLFYNTTRTHIKHTVSRRYTHLCIKHTHTRTHKGKSGSTPPFPFHGRPSWSQQLCPRPDPSRGSENQEEASSVWSERLFVQARVCPARLFKHTSV